MLAFLLLFLVLGDGSAQAEAAPAAPQPGAISLHGGAGIASTAALRAGAPPARTSGGGGGKGASAVDTGTVAGAVDTGAAGIWDEEPFSYLHAHRLELGVDGTPLVTVGVDRGKEEVALTPRGTGRLLLPGGRERPLEGGEAWRVRVVSGKPAKLRWLIPVQEVPLQHQHALAAALTTWTERGFEPESRVLGAAFALGGRMIDTRRKTVVLVAADEEAALALVERARRFGVSPTVLEEAVGRQGGTIEIRDAKGGVVAVAQDAIYLEATGGVAVQQVEHDMGYATHGREDRIYRGGIFVTVDTEGKAAVVNLVRLEDHLRGIVPSEIFASAPMEALKAQAVAARGEVLAKIGARHLADPHLLCAEQHCQVTKGLGGEHPRTDEAVQSTSGEVLLGRGGGLVDTVYSSTCGGHTEDNEVAWGTPPNPHLRGTPDLLDGEAMCQVASFSRQEKYRWTRTFSAAELDGLLGELGVGRVQELEVLGRGVSGRGTGLRVVGSSGEAHVWGELRIRRLLGNLNSSRFVVERKGGRWTFHGGGWGHGVGMCQMGAIGRAERGQGHREILGHYYGGARTVRLYPSGGRQQAEVTADKSPSLSISR